MVVICHGYFPDPSGCVVVKDENVFTCRKDTVK